MLRTTAKVLRNSDAVKLFRLATDSRDGTNGPGIAADCLGAEHRVPSPDCAAAGSPGARPPGPKEPGR